MSISALTPERVRLGITPTLWSNDDFPTIDQDISFGECISEMALAGFQGCSIGHKYPTDPAELRSALELRGLVVSEPWVSTYFTVEGMQEQTVDAFRERLDFVRAVGGQDIVVAEFGRTSHILPIGLFANRAVFDDREWDRLCAGLNQLGRIAADAGMRLCYHHHLGTGVMTRADVNRLLAGTDPKLVHLLLDTGHLAAAGDDPLSAAQALAARIKHVHLKDVRPTVVDRVRTENLSFQQGIEEGIFTVPGDGGIAFEPILAALGAAGYEGWLVVEAEQDPAKANPLEYAQRARAYLRDVLGW